MTGGLTLQQQLSRFRLVPVLVISVMVLACGPGESRERQSPELKKVEESHGVATGPAVFPVVQSGIVRGGATSPPRNIPTQAVIRVNRVTNPAIGPSSKSGPTWRPYTLLL